MALLGELPLIDGEVEVEGRVAFASQQPWVFSASVRQNIIFSVPFDADRYSRVIQATALTKVCDTSGCPYQGLWNYRQRRLQTIVSQ